MFQLADKLVKNPHAGVLGLVYTEAWRPNFYAPLSRALIHCTRMPASTTAAMSSNAWRARVDTVMTHLAPAPTIKPIGAGRGNE